MDHRPLRTAKPTLKAWIDRLIENPVLLYPALGLVVLATLSVVFVGIGSRTQGTKPDVAAKAKVAEAKPKTVTEVSGSESSSPRALAVEQAPVSPQPESSPAASDIGAVSSPADSPPDQTAKAATAPTEPAVTPAEAGRPSSPADALGLRPAAGGKFTSLRLDEAHAPLELVKFEPGQFRFGVRPADLQAGELAEEPGRIDRPYFLSTTEVTNRQYDAFAKAVGDETAGFKWRLAWNSNPEKDNSPVVDVSLQQARAFCQWLGGRLPTEREWERAARGVQGRTTPWEGGPVDATRCRLRFDDHSTLVNVTDLAEGAGPDGLLHMLGNVAEWCEDVYAPGYQEGPGDPGANRWNVVRGGSYLDAPHRIRTTSRTNAAPEGAPYVGFRVAM